MAFVEELVLLLFCANAGADPVRLGDLATKNSTKGLRIDEGKRDMNNYSFR